MFVIDLTLRAHRAPLHDRLPWLGGVCAEDVIDIEDLARGDVAPDRAMAGSSTGGNADAPMPSSGRLGTLGFAQMDRRLDQQNEFEQDETMFMDPAGRLPPTMDELC
jgi:hypothetical protein